MGIERDDAVLAFSGCSVLYKKKSFSQRRKVSTKMVYQS